MSSTPKYDRVPPDQQEKPGRSNYHLWRAAFLLSALEGAAAFIILTAIPSDEEPGRLVGFSAGRLLLKGVLIALTAGAGFAAWACGRPAAAARLKKLSAKWAAAGLAASIVTAAASLLALHALFSLYRTSGDFHYFAYAERLSPLFTWIALTSTQIGAVLAAKGNLHWQALAQQRPVFRAALVAWVCFGLAALFSIATGVGLRPDVIGWGKPAVALMEWQILLAWAVGTALVLVLLKSGAPRRVDWFISASIWLLAVLVWLSQPVRPAFFATQGRAPNFEIYPFSDGAYYGTFAQSLLTGGGFKGEEIPPRPLYITLLAGFHALAGQRYEDVIALQTLVLGFFPVVLYLLGKELHSRPAGLAAAIMAVLRELTAIIAAPFTDNASNSQLFFADLPTALAISLWLLVVVRWLKSPLTRPLYPLIVGGGLGLVMLFRTQTMFLIPAVLLMALIVLRFRWGVWLRSVGLAALGLMLVVSPWMLRSWANTGQIAFDDPKSQTGSMAARYSLSGRDDSAGYRPGEDMTDYSRRVSGSIFRFLISHPGVVARFIAAHFFNAEIANVLVLPVRDDLVSPRELWVPTAAFWEAWDGSLSARQGLHFALHLGLIALGIGSSWKRAGWAGLAPLAANLSYNLSMSLARNSGGRYLLAVDWVSYLYAAVGLVEITLTVAALGGAPARRIFTQPPARAGEPPASFLLPRALPVVVRVGLAFWLAGSLPVLAERLAPPRYPEQDAAVLLAEAAQAPGVDRAALEVFAAQPGVLIAKGRALYPRYYEAGDGEPQTAKTGYEPLDYGRLLFQMVSPNFNGLVMIPSGAPPESFPNAADVLVVGCFTGSASGGVIFPAVVVVGGDRQAVYVPDGGLPADCSQESGSSR